MASVRKRSGSWQVRWRLPSGQSKAETARGWTKQEALEYGRAQEEAVRRTPWITTAPSESPFLNDYGPAVLDSRSITDKRKKDDVAAWRNRIEEYFDGLRIAAVSPTDVRSMVTALTEKDYAASTVRDTYRLVAYVFSTAQADGLIAATPCVRVSLPKRHHEDEVKPADPEAVQAIADAIDPRYRPLVFFLATTGVRIGEALAVRRIDLIELPRPAVRISKTLHDDGTLGLTKTRRSRVIVLADWYAPILADHLKSGTSEMVFPSPKGKALPPRRFSSRYWRPATLDAGHPGVTPHQFRHLHATLLLEEGRPLTEVSSRLGHRNPRVTAEFYAAWIREDDSGAADATPDFTKPLRIAGSNR